MGAREEAEKNMALLNADPQEYLRQANERINDRSASVDGGAYFDGHRAWLKLGQPERELEDLNMAVGIKPTGIRLHVRGRLYMELGRFQEAKVDFLHGQALNPKSWHEIQGDISQAYCHARLGEAEAALAICQAQSDNPNYWYGGVFELQGGWQSRLDRWH